MGVYLTLFAVVVFLLAPAITIGVNDQSRGGAKLAWVVLGLVFSWLAVIVWAIATERKAGRYECEQCRELIRYQARICPFCRSAIERPRAEPGAILREPAVRVKRPAAST